MGNAIKFTEKGHVLVTVGCEESSAKHAVLRISVEDTGPGVPTERQEEIFDKFRQLDGSATRQHTGTGLGLTITRELVHLMGGEIGLESVPGRGSTFWLSSPHAGGLPLHTASAGSQPTWAITQLPSTHAA